jgi:hypothetical protein
MNMQLELCARGNQDSARRLSLIRDIGWLQGEISQLCDLASLSWDDLRTFRQFLTAAPVSKLLTLPRSPNYVYLGQAGSSSFQQAIAARILRISEMRANSSNKSPSDSLLHR